MYNVQCTQLTVNTYRTLYNVHMLTISTYRLLYNLHYLRVHAIHSIQCTLTVHCVDCTGICEHIFSSVRPVSLEISLNLRSML